MNKPQLHEKGQILIIFVLVLIALLGLTALAIDGGMIYADRRYDQAAADASSLGGAGAAAQLLERYGITWTTFHCTALHGQQAQQKAVNIAKNIGATNQFATLDGNLTDKHGIVTSCVDNYAAWDKHVDVRTQISSQVSTAFAQLFFTGPIINTVDSVVRIRPRTEVGFGYAIASLGSVCETKLGGVTMGGTSDTVINGGGIFTNSCLDVNGSGTVKVSGGGIEYLTTYHNASGAPVTPLPVQAPNSMDTIKLDPVPCGASAPILHHGGGTINPGNYTLIKQSAPTNLILNPGLYCLTGNMEITGGSITGNGVTIYVMNNGATPSVVTISGGVKADLSAPTRSNVTGGAIVGMLIYSAPGNLGLIKLQGNSESKFLGTVYGPTSPIEVGGTTGLNPTYNTQLVGAYVKLNGNSKIDINFSGFEPASDPPRLDQQQ